MLEKPKKKYYLKKSAETKKTKEKQAPESKPKKVKGKKGNEVKIKEKHKKVFKKLAENGCSQKDALKEAGYSKSVQESPTKVTKSKSWQQLLDERLSNEILSDVHSKLLKDKDGRIRTKAVDMGYKLRGNYAPEKKIVAKTRNLKDLFKDSEYGKGKKFGKSD